MSSTTTLEPPRNAHRGIALKVAALAVAIFTCEVIVSLLTQTGDPVARTTLSLAAVNGGAGEQAMLRTYETLRPIARTVLLFSYATAAYLLFASDIRTILQKLNTQHEQR